MEKTIYTREYEVLLRLLREARTRAGILQTDLAQRLGQRQSFVSKVECGERRIDLIELRTILGAIGVKLSDFVGKFEQELTRQR